MGTLIDCFGHQLTGTDPYWPEYLRLFISKAYLEKDSEAQWAKQTSWVCEELDNQLGYTWSVDQLVALFGESL